MQVKNCLTVAFSCTLSCLSSTLPLDGWFDVRKTESNAHVIGVAASGSTVAIAMSEGRCARLYLYDQTLVEIKSWTIPRHPFFLALTSAHVIVGYRSAGGDEPVEVCPYSLDGESAAACLALGGWPDALTGVGDRVYALQARYVSELDFLRQRVIRRTSTPVTDDGPLLWAVAGDHIIRAGSIALNGSVFAISKGIESGISLLSPQLAINRSRPHPSDIQQPNRAELLASHLVGLEDGGVWW